MGIMTNLRYIAVFLLCSAVVAGCAGPQKRVVPEPRPSAAESERPTYAGIGESEASGADRRKEVIQPKEIEIPYDYEAEIDPANVQGPLPSMDYINDRIFEYGRKLERWRQMDAQSVALELSQEDTEVMVSCFVDLQSVLDGYNQLRADMLRLDTSSAPLIISSEEVMELQKSDISFLESICGKLLSPEGDEIVDWANREAEADLPQLETLIERYTDTREYEEVIQVWQRIPEQQIDRVHLRTRILYANALMLLHQEEKAARMFQQIVDEMSASEKQKTDLLSLRRVLADLYTASGNYDAAKRQYLNISKDYQELGSIEEWSKLQLDLLERGENDKPELQRYSRLLRDFLGFIPERDGFKIIWEAEDFLQEYPYSSVATNVEILKADMERRAKRWFASFFAEVEALAAENQYLDAIARLEAIPGDIISPEQKELIEEKNDDLILAEAVERETRKIEKMQELQERWNEGMIQVEAGNYDEAIAIFQTLLQTEYFAKAKDKIEELTLLAAKTDRRSAADLYIRYTKTSDIEMKKKLLTESRRLLTEILGKYPGVAIIDKVQGNIERVEQEMNSLDPMLLPTIRAAERGESIEQAPLVENDFAFDRPLEPQPSEAANVEERTIVE